MLRRLAALLCMTLMVALAVILPATSSHAAVPAHQAVHTVAAVHEAPPATVVHTASTPAVTYTVKSGDTLWGIAASHLGSGAKFPQLAAANGIANPNLIFPGEKITISGSASVTTTITTKPVAPKSSSPPTTGTVVGGGCSFRIGTYSFAQLETIWVCNGGSVAAERTAAAVALCESSGISTNTNGNDVGLWQINRPSWGPLASFSPSPNAKAAIIISHNGTNWNPWVCFTDGGYLKFLG